MADRREVLRSFRAAVAALDGGSLTTRASVVMLGDSWIGQNMITSPVRERLQRQFGNAGFGFVSFNTSAVVAGNGAQYHYTLSVPVDWSVGVSSATPGPDTSAVVSATAGSTITLVAKDVTQLRLMFQRQAGGGVFSWSVDGGVPVEVDTSTGPAGPDLVAIPGLAAGQHTLLATVVSGAVTLCGAILDKGASGVQVHRVGLSGSNTGVWTRADATKWAAAIALLNPSVITITLGVNDSGSTINATAAAANISTLVDRIRAVLPLTDIVLVPQADVADATGAPNYPTGDTIAAYAAAYEALAITRGLGFVPVTANFGTAVESVALGLYQAGDYRHPTPLGGRIIADLVIDHLLHGIRPLYDGAPRGDNISLPERPGRLTAGHSNTALGGSTSYGGKQALGCLTTGQYNSAVGAGALSGMTTGRYSVALGYDAGKSFNGDAGVFIGCQAGAQATGAGNILIGFQAAPALTSGAWNVSIGANALNSLQTANNNTAIGANAGQSALAANGTFIGRYSGYQTTASGCTAIGASSGMTNTTGANNTWIGLYADSAAPGLTKAIAIGYNAKVSTSNAAAIGGKGADAVKVGVDGVDAPTASLDAGGDAIRIRTPRTPVNATAPGNPGEVCWDGGFIYVCVASNSWKRATLETWT